MKEKYKLIADGWLYQIPEGEIQTYDEEYVSQYNNYPDTLQRLRFDFISKYLKFDSVLDVGYGNGDFLKVCREKGKVCYGNDISGYTLPEGVEFTKDRNIPVDLVTFFDCLEHFPQEDLWNVLGDLNCNYLCVTVPWCHWVNDMEKFENWKHRKPNEHFHHFNTVGLHYLFDKAGFDLRVYDAFEDQIRKGTPGPYQNILTVLGQKRD